MSGTHHPQTLATGGDGTKDRWRRSIQAPVAAIFIHAGAGYHSTANERMHLEACDEAARVAMRFLRVGADATTAVEAAIKSLEDKEITNAGFGSNLNMDGVVEGDATIVDYLGRSGACGAVPGIKNPISLAKIILDATSQTLSLRRVPPNILVGTGAKRFAEEHGMPSVMNEFLVSKNAKDRYARWYDDLRKAHEADRSQTYGHIAPSQPSSSIDYEYIPESTRRRDHFNAIMHGTWNEGQPDSPSNGNFPPMANGYNRSTGGTPRASHNVTPTDTPMGARFQDRSPLSSSTTTQGPQPATSPSSGPKFGSHHGDGPHRPSGGTNTTNPSLRQNAPHDRAMNADWSKEVGNGNDPNKDLSDKGNNVHDIQVRAKEEGAFVVDSSAASVCDNGQLLDRISDTVGAIAIDLNGRMAAASSSGGIGMKHRGRVGPAALVGIGTAMIPEDPDDEDRVSVAAVTSGTGEHMATALASQKCAERLYHCTRRGPGGRDVLDYDEDAVMESFVTRDFMGHPGVRNQPSAGAIGVMAVKKTRTGYYFFFAHNTDSFALSSMGSNEREPVCTMSRVGQMSEVIRGGRKIRLE